MKQRLQEKANRKATMTEALISACRECYDSERYGAAQLLLNSGADVNGMDEYGRTALTTASQFGPPNLVRLLLDRGADVNLASGLADDNRLTALIWASRVGHVMCGAAPSQRRQHNLSIVELLLARGADLTQTDKDGRTALYWARRRRSNRDVEHNRDVELLLLEATVWLLLERGANANLSDVVPVPDGSPLSIAINEEVKGLLRAKREERKRSWERCERIAEELMKVVWHPEGRMLKYEELDELD